MKVKPSPLPSSILWRSPKQSVASHVEVADGDGFVGQTQGGEVLLELDEMPVALYAAQPVLAESNFPEDGAGGSKLAIGQLIQGDR